ncbi:tetratricopeptide repeat protein [Kitasatospora nipponensis]|uniref:Tetratricopeptide repeat protein n=1 Tax=Kitasatospora nipponensis TaxID=258049 RepID=A0ABN1T7M8_9ACTN
MRRLPLLLTTAALCGGLVAFGGLDRAGHRAAAPPATTVRPGGAPAPGGGTLAQAISADQQRLREIPTDAAGWARLGAEYVEQARITADASYYPKADDALHRSLGLQPDADTEALTGLGALDNARHRFADARDAAQRALAQAPLHWQAYAVLADARTQLGDDAGATEAVQQLLDHHPGTASFTRAAYDLEQHGHPDQARAALQQALDGAYDPGDRAFCHHQIAELERNAGHPDQALADYRQALTDDPGYSPALAGKARVEAALGDTAAALADYTGVVARVPQPQYLLELGELQESLGHLDQAREQYRLLAAEQQLAAANGVVDDLTIGQYQADHGDAGQAVTVLRAEWQRRQNVLVADALGWALHRRGDDDQALPLAEQAGRLGWHNALFSYHRGEIERSLGRTADARDHLAEALRTDPYFSPLLAPAARTALAALGGTP